MSEKIELTSQWHTFIQSWLALADENGFPQLEPDSNWPSPCEFEQDGKWHWQPQKIEESLTFSNVEHAIGFELNDAFKAFFSLYYSENIDAKHSDGYLQYLQAWSKTDFERLQQNLIGHLMMKSRLKQPATLFFALTDEEDLNIVIVNDTGEVALEYVGKEPHKTLAASLPEFIAQTEPLLVRD